jgi:hypothetical protein
MNVILSHYHVVLEENWIVHISEIVVKKKNYQQVAQDGLAA